ncbi:MULTISPECIES: sunset domain-containing protein [Oceanobacillus]|uniref:sunset domain-containing protein n=1 Tax=Oceanobacillus TaxID=182709 RepID=UPI0030D8250D
MDTLLVLSMIFILSSLAIYTLSHPSSKGKMKKKLLPVLAFAMLLTVLSGCGTEGTDNAADLDKEIEKNEELTAEIEELENANSTLQEEYDDLQSQVGELKEENEKLEDYEEIKEENESLSEEITALKEENEKLEDYEAIKEENESLSEEIAALKESNSELQQQLEASQEAGSSSNSTADASETSEEDSADDSTSQAVEGDCNIKGSKSGIYHTPGSTYYDRTTNVVEWFCSESEAQDAGYRAPKN